MLHASPAETLSQLEHRTSSHIEFISVPIQGRMAPVIGAFSIGNSVDSDPSDHLIRVDLPRFTPTYETSPGYDTAVESSPFLAGFKLTHVGIRLEQPVAPRRHVFFSDTGVPKAREEHTSTLSITRHAGVRSEEGFGFVYVSPGSLVSVSADIHRRTETSTLMTYDALNEYGKQNAHLFLAWQKVHEEYQRHKDILGLEIDETELVWTGLQDRLDV